MTDLPRKVLFLCNRVPYPPDRGDRISTHHVLRRLLQHGMQIRVGCLAEDDRDLESAATIAGRLEAICAPRINPKLRRAMCLRGLLTGEPLTLPYVRQSELYRTVRRWVHEDPPDLVFCYSSSAAIFVKDDDTFAKVMQFAELDSDKWRQYASRSGPFGKFIYGREARLLLEFERHVARTFDASLVVSEIERELFLEYIPDVEPLVFPNGVDVDDFQSTGDASREPHTAVFTGVMDYDPNVDGVLWFAADSWPKVRERFPDARLLVVGNRPCAAIQKLGGAHGITVTGYVDKTQPYFDAASVAIAPLRLARGVQNKVLEAMSMALPVVATTPGSQGLGQIDADTLLVRDDAESIADEVIALFDDPVRARAIGTTAARFVRENFHWDAMFERLDQILLSVMRHRAGR